MRADAHAVLADASACMRTECMRMHTKSYRCIVDLHEHRNRRVRSARAPAPVKRVPIATTGAANGAHALRPAHLRKAHARRPYPSLSPPPSHRPIRLPPANLRKAHARWGEDGGRWSHGGARERRRRKGAAMAGARRHRHRRHARGGAHLGVGAGCGGGRCDRAGGVRGGRVGRSAFDETEDRLPWVELGERGRRRVNRRSEVAAAKHTPQAC